MRHLDRGFSNFRMLDVAMKGASQACEPGEKWKTYERVERGIDAEDFPPAKMGVQRRR